MKLRSILIAASLVSIALASGTAVASHDSTTCELEDPPGVIVATIPTSQTGQAGDIYINDRPGDGAPTGTGLFTGNGTWVYEESNGIPGLQINQDKSDPGQQEICGHESDTLIF